MVDQPEEILRRIAVTREEIGLTAEALAERADVVSRAKRSLAQVRSSMNGGSGSSSASSSLPEPIAGAVTMVRELAKTEVGGKALAAVAGLAVGFLLFHRRRRHRW